MRRKINKIVITAALFAVVGCSSGFRDTFGLRRNAPDEFRVVSNAPLSLPPEFTLRPPMPGAKRPQDQGLDQQAKDILLEGSARSGSSETSKGEDVFLKKADVSAADPEIKNVLNQEEIDKTTVERKKGFLQKFAEFTHLKSKDEPSVNASKEKARIEKNKSDGKPVNEGEVPVVKEGKASVIKKVFGN